MNYLEQLKKEKELKPDSATRLTDGPVPRRQFGKAKPVIRDIVPPKATAEKSYEVQPHKIHEVEPRKVERQPPSPELALGEEELPIRAWKPEKARRLRLRLKIALWTAGAAVLAGFLVPLAAFPKFSIAIFPKIFSIAVPGLELTADTALTAPDISQKKIPAMRIEVEKTVTREYEATGTKFFRDKAKGEVLIFNAYSSSPQTLVAQTRFQDSSGKVFRLQKAIIIPGAEIQEGKIAPTSIKAEVAAESPGEAYNIGPAEFRIPGFRGTPRYQGFYAKSEERFSGGFEGEARVVLANDLKTASEDVTKALVEELRSELEARAPAGPDFLAPNGGRETAVTKIEQPKAGERYERFKITASGRGRLLVMRRSHLAETLGAVILASSPELGARFPSEQGKLSFSGIRPAPAPTQLRLTVSGELDYWRDIDADDIAKTLRTSTPRKAEAYLRGREEIGSFRMKRFPRWLWFIPKREGGLEIKVQPPA